VEREPYNLLFGERKGPDGRKLGRSPASAGKVAENYKSLLAAEPSADDHRRAALRIEAHWQARQSPLYFDLTVSWSKDISIFHASLGAAAVQRALGTETGEMEAALHQPPGTEVKTAACGLRMDQAAAAFHVLTSDRRVEVIVGPVG
jgi:hypothetical protein